PCPAAYFTKAQGEALADLADTHGILVRDSSIPGLWWLERLPVTGTASRGPARVEERLRGSPGMYLRRCPRMCRNEAPANRARIDEACGGPMDILRGYRQLGHSKHPQIGDGGLESSHLVLLVGLIAAGTRDGFAHIMVERIFGINTSRQAR